MRLDRVTIDGHVATYGVAGAGPPLVFLHGWSLGWRSYRRALTTLAGSGWRVYAPALPGFAGAPELPSEARTIGGYAAWARAFLDAVVPDQPVALVGHSFGGGVAIRTAYDAPQRVQAVVVVNSVGGSAWTRRGSTIRSIAERPLWDWGLHLSRDLMPIRQLTRVLPVVAADVVPNLLRNPAAILRIGRIAARADLSAELQELQRRRVPVVIVWGREDRFLPRLALQSLQECVGGECVTVEGRHLWLITEPRRFTEVITNLLPVAETVPGAQVVQGAPW